MLLVNNWQIIIVWNKNLQRKKNIQLDDWHFENKKRAPQVENWKKKFFLLSILIVTVSFPEPSTILFLIYYLKIRYPHIFSRIILPYPLESSFEFLIGQKQQQYS